MRSPVADTGPTAVNPALYKEPLPVGLHLVVVSGPDRGLSLALRQGQKYTVGKAPTSELCLTDPLVSREHMRLHVEHETIKVLDLASRNGSFFEGARFDSIVVGMGATFVIGETELRVAANDGAHQVLPAEREAFGDLIGTSAAMRRVFALLERVAPTDTAVLIQGETGTGKELAAEAIHRASNRREGRFVVCDLGASSPTLIESELFGHVKGAFTGADRDREGAFRQAHGGTIFLDEIGELDLKLQPRLLRALERKQIKPVGGSAYQAVNVRVISATNRDLTAEVRAGQFRADLYHRLAVMRIEIPPLRDRSEDVASLVELFLGRAASDNPAGVPKLPAASLTALAEHDWPGNVRELRNVLERAALLGFGTPGLMPELLGLPSTTTTASAPTLIDASTGLTFKEAKDQLISAWEREYLSQILERAGRNVSLAARRAGIARVYLHELMKKHGLER